MSGDAATRPDIPAGPLVMPQDEYALVRKLADATKACGCGPLEPCKPHRDAGGLQDWEGRARAACEHPHPDEDPCGAVAPYTVSAGSRRHDAQASCERHLEATVSALEGAEGRDATLVIAGPAPALTVLAEAADARDRFREQARILGEAKAEWLCEACEVIHPWRDGGRFTAACPVCGWPMVPTSVSVRALQEARALAVAAEAKLAAIEALFGEGAPAVAVDRIEAILRSEEPPVFSATCTGQDCGQQFTDSETSEYEFATRKRMEKLLRADGWQADPVLCPACQPEEQP